MDQTVQQMATFRTTDELEYESQQLQRFFRLYGFQSGYGPHPASSPIDIRVKVTGV